MANVGNLTAVISADTKQFEAGVRRANRDAKRFTDSMAKQARAVGKTRDEAKLYELQLRGASRASLAAASSALAHKRAMDQQYASAKRMRALAVRGGQMAGAAAVAGGAIAARSVFDAVREAEKFSKELNASMAILPNAAESVRAEMQRTAFDVAADSRFMADEAAKAFFFLESAGMNARQSIAALPQVTKFAQAGNFDLATATDLATDAQSAMGLSARDARQNLANLTRVTDVLIAANTKANATAQQFSQALTSGAAVAARNMGVSLEETVATLAVFADQGVKADVAGTQFGIVLKDLSTKAIRNAASFKKAGVEVFNAAGEFRGVAKVVGDLETALGALSAEQQKATLLTLGFSDKSVMATQTLLGYSKRIRELAKEFENVEGITERVAAKQMTDLEKSTAKVSAEFGRLRQQLAEPLTSELAKGLKVIADALTDIEGNRGTITRLKEELAIIGAGGRGTLSAVLGGDVQSPGMVGIPSKAASDNAFPMYAMFREAIRFTAPLPANRDAVNARSAQIAAQQDKLQERFLAGPNQGFAAERNIVFPAMAGGRAPGAPKDAEAIRMAQDDLARLSKAMRRVASQAEHAADAKTFNTMRAQFDHLNMQAEQVANRLRELGGELKRENVISPATDPMVVAARASIANGVSSLVGQSMNAAGHFSFGGIGAAAARMGGLGGAMLNGGLAAELFRQSPGAAPSVGTVSGLEAGGLGAFRISQAARARSEGPDGEQQANKKRDRMISLLGEIAMAVRNTGGEGMKAFSLILGGEGEE